MNFIRLTLFPLLLFVSLAYSQTSQVEALKQKLNKDSTRIYRIKPVLPIIALDQRNSFLGKTKVNVAGIQLGFRLFEQQAMGIGFYSIRDATKRSKVVGDQKQNFTQSLELNYMTTFYYYPLIDRKHFEFGFPIESGLGSYTINVTDSLGRPVPSLQKDRKPILVFGTGISTSLKPIRWLGVNFTGGYRIVQDKKTRQNFNGVYYSFGLEFYIHEILQDTRYGLKKLHCHRKVRKLEAKEH
jgi:hypothetical protein